MTTLLKPIAIEYGFDLTDSMLQQFDTYNQLLVDWNTRMNLTAITEPREVAVKHFLDSLLLLKAAEIGQGVSLIDVGTGAGFPAVPVKIARPDIQVTMLDSLNKRIGFLTALSEALGQDNTCIHGRAEEFGRNPALREQYDVATARAVAALPALCEYCLPFVKVGGIFAALKGGHVEEEAKAAEKAMATLGGKLRAVKPFTLPGGDARSIVVIEKVQPTPAKYPRAAVKITKNPL